MYSSDGDGFGGGSGSSSDDGRGDDKMASGIYKYLSAAPPLSATGSTSAAAPPCQLHPFHQPQMGPWWPQPSHHCRRLCRRCQHRRRCRRRRRRRCHRCGLPHCCYLVWGGYGLSNCVREGTGCTSTSTSSHSHRIFPTASNNSCSSSGSGRGLNQE